VQRHWLVASSRGGGTPPQRAAHLQVPSSYSHVVPSLQVPGGAENVFGHVSSFGRASRPASTGAPRPPPSWSPEPEPESETDSVPVADPPLDDAPGFSMLEDEPLQAAIATSPPIQPARNQRAIIPSAGEV
jgi:hypothetical protein